MSQSAQGVEPDVTLPDVWRGFSGLVRAAAVAHAAVALLRLAAAAALLHGVQHRAAGLQGAPRWRREKR
ncbi:hypothetical protein EYF80_063160 [Liparis tanakae]|uniref:Uncharacterized protein n=1 Tax=Liparis tanakae TaxID=230148 RepID=A0A4Z2ED92_9TELE|nr:hypothetical protein EYF80_063160 [Liparis tanakae]